MPIGPEPADAVIRAEAEAWFARMQGPDAQDTAAAFEHWRESDPRCQQAYASLERKIEVTKLLHFTATGRERDLTRARASSLMAKPIRYKIAAAVLVLLCVAGAASLLRGAPVSKTAFAATRIGQIRPQRLADGSLVILDTNSQIAFDLSGRARIVRLVRGRARFDVAHNPDRPFIVEAAGQTVTATGTIFDVALYGANVRVSLLRGSVEIARDSALRRSRGSVARLRPGEAVDTTIGQPMHEVTPAARGEDQWVGGMLSFDATPLSEVLGQTNRYSTTHIRLAEPTLAGLKVSGAFHPVPLDDLSKSLATAFSLHAETLSNGDIVLHKR
jgi:transmembrane sensor